MVWSKYVMQWINEPENAVLEFRRVTKPGGVIVCCNFDGFAVTHYPEDAELQPQILTVFPRLVDVHIGRKTAPIFHVCGLSDISVDFEPDALYTTIGSIDPERTSRDWQCCAAICSGSIGDMLGLLSGLRAYCRRILCTTIER